MNAQGYSGRGNRYYPPDEQLLSVPYREPQPGWNKPKTYVTPFGLRVFTDLTVVLCGNCGKIVFRPGSERHCRCDYVTANRRDND